MDVTTVGSNIVAVTPTGKILSVLLAALGMMMFPIFTVYVTSLVQRANKEKEAYYAKLNGAKGYSAVINQAAPDSENIVENDSPTTN